MTWHADCYREVEDVMMHTTLLLDVGTEFASRVSAAIRSAGHRVVATTVAGAERQARGRSVAVMMLDIRLMEDGTAFVRTQRARGWSGVVLLVADASEEASALAHELRATLLPREGLTPARVAAADRCRSAAEDLDGFDDADGCAELDNDRDGIPDAVDACRDSGEDADGFNDADGCPDADNDADGVLDAADRCPVVAEDVDAFEDADGCPDLDNDGDSIADTNDRCPIEPETVNTYQDADGCADTVPEAVQKFSGTIAGVNFESGKAKLLPSSLGVLDAAAAVLGQFPEIRLEVQGHTDDQGDDGKNLALSQARAQSVVDYLVSRGVAADRLVAKGYGEAAPRVANDSKPNRATNRRVEFKRL